ncbi:MAG TPA: AAA family ATPase, partial [Patescibacteria group bacterium]|nr:AAA family ATPase [Patescibacteria group bacterium]
MDTLTPCPSQTNWLSGPADIPPAGGVFRHWGHTFQTSNADAWRRSCVYAKVLSRLDGTVRKILPDGRLEHGLYHAGKFIVSVKDGTTRNGLRLHPGQWIDNDRMQIGDDIFSLFSHINDVPYDRAVDVLAHQFGVIKEKGALDCQVDKLSGFVQEHKPLHIPDWPSHRFPSDADTVFYKNEIGGRVGAATRWKSANGEYITIYSILLRRYDGYSCQWMEVFPERPLMLLNSERICTRPHDKVYLVGDEFEAEKLSGIYSCSIYSAVPGGLGNIPNANLDALSGRQVCVIFDDENLAYGKQIAKKFKEVGIDDASFGFNCGFLETHRYFDDVETIANRRHIELLPPSEQTIQANALEPSDYSTFMQYELPERAFIISPIISEQGLVMLHAPRGIGKTHVALGIAMAVATGSSFLRWHAPKPKRVLYLDGEMPATMMRSRLKAITAGLGKVPGDGYFRLLNPDLIDASMPDIGTEEGQAGLDEYLHGIELLVIDNLSTLCRSGRENESESWEPIQSWLLNLRRRGIAVLIVHHSGKNGNQRGTSRREDVLDTVLKLK